MNDFREIAVPFSSIPIIKGESAKQMLEDAKIPLLTEEFLKECKKVLGVVSDRNHEIIRRNL